MSKIIEFTYCELPATPWEFNIEKFKAGDKKQEKLYKDAKTPNRDKTLTYEEVTDKLKKSNYARVVPKNCCFIDYDNKYEFERIREFILHEKQKCLILETPHGGQFLFRKPEFYKKEMTGATNWFGMKFDCKATTDAKNCVQIMRVCGMDRKETTSWDKKEVVLEELDIDKLDILPYWLWGKLKDEDLHKKGKTGDREEPTHKDYTLKDNPFTQLMTMREGGRHDHIVSRCSYFALSNGFTIDEFKTLIQIIHDRYLVELGTPMSDSDLFGDLEKRWDDYIGTLTSEGWEYREEERKWVKVKDKKSDKMDERRAAEWLYKQFDFYVTDKNADGTYNKLLHRDKDGNYEYRNNVPERKQKLREYSNQNLKDPFFKEVEVQLMQMCIENNKIIIRSNTYIIVKNKILSCISPTVYDFSWLDTKPPTDVVLPWNWYSEEWVEEHKDDLGGLITKFIKELSRDSSGIPQPEVEQWLWVIAGACMIPANRLERIVILSGGGQNGKSLFTSLIKLCLGEAMFNESKIFDKSNDSFWGKDLDKGICCIVDDMPRTYNRDALTNIKGAITGTDTVEINEKHKPKRKLEVLPQIIACTNFDFELYDKSEGMERRILILPTEFHIDDSIKDEDLQYKLVLNTNDSKTITKYQMSEDAFSHKGSKVMHMYTEEKCVLDSLDHGSLAWFANKARYTYMKWKMKELKLEYNPRMKNLLKQAFDDSPKGQCNEFISWYLTSTCGGTDASKFDLSLANCFSYELPDIYKAFCKGVRF